LHGGSWAPWAQNLLFWRTLLPRSQKSDKLDFHMGGHTTNVMLVMRRSWNMTRRVDVDRHVWISYRSVPTDVLIRFVCVYVCTVTDFSGEDKLASGIKFCTVVQGVLGRESPILGKFAQILGNRMNQ